MRINDDRKISLQLQEFKEEGLQVVLLVRSFDLRLAKDIPENTYDESWFRLVNETTSQTLDYTKIKKIEVPEGYDESPADEDDSSRNELIFVAGRLFKEEVYPKTGEALETPKWIYEKYNQVTTSSKFPNIH